MDKKKKKYLVILSAGALILVIILVWAFSGGTPDPVALAAEALNPSSTSPRRVAAAKQLAKLTELGKADRARGKGVPEKVAELEKGAVAGLRRVVNDSQDPAVLAVAIDGLSAANDTGNILLLYAAMDHENREVREAAFKFVLRLNGGTLPHKLNFEVDGPKDQRDKVMKRLRDIDKEAKASSPYPK